MAHADAAARSREPPGRCRVQLPNPVGLDASPAGVCEATCALTRARARHGTRSSVTGSTSCTAGSSGRSFPDPTTNPATTPPPPEARDLARLEPPPRSGRDTRGSGSRSILGQSAVILRGAVWERCGRTLEDGRSSGGIEHVRGVQRGRRSVRRRQSEELASCAASPSAGLRGPVE